MQLRIHRSTTGGHVSRHHHIVIGHVEASIPPVKVLLVEAALHVDIHMNVNGHHIPYLCISTIKSTIEEQ